MRLVGVEDLLSVPKPRMVVEGILPERGIVLLAGQPKVGKTFLALECAIAIATGGFALGGFQADRGAVLYVGEDAPPFDVAHQVRMLMARRGLLSGDLERLKFAIFQGARIDTVEGITAIERALREVEERDQEGDLVHGCNLLILDSFRKLHSRNENDSEEMRTVMALLRVLAERTCVLVLHHFSKPGEGRPAGPRGSGEIEAGCDAAFYLRHRTGGIQATLARARAIDADDFHYTLNYTREEAWLDLTKPEEDATDSILTLLRSIGKPFGAQEVIELVTARNPGMKPIAAKLRFYRAVDKLIPQGLVRKLPRRKYEVVS